MHRTEGPDYVEESGLRRHKVAPPPGTIVNHEFLNAVQEEIANVVDYAGLTIESTALADRTAGWIQLRDAIFNSEAIDTAALADGAVTDAKMTSCDVAKLTYTYPGGLDLDYSSGGDDYNISFDPTELTLNLQSGIYDTTTTLNAGTLGIITNASGILSEGASLSTTLLTISDWSAYPTAGDSVSLGAATGLSHSETVSGSVNDRVTLSYSGLNFYESGSASGGPIKFKIFNFDSASWTGSGPYTATLSTSLSTANLPVSADFRYRYVSSGTVHVYKGSTNTEAYNIAFTVSGGTWNIQVTHNLNLTGATWDQRRLIVWYTT